MQREIIIPWSELNVRLQGCTCCGRGIHMPTEEELEQRITEQIDKESFERAILSKIDNKDKAVNV